MGNNLHISAWHYERDQGQFTLSEWGSFFFPAEGMLDWGGGWRELGKPSSTGSPPWDVFSRVYWTVPSILNLFQIPGLEPDDLDFHQEKILLVAALCALRVLQGQQLKFNEPGPEAATALSVWHTWLTQFLEQTIRSLCLEKLEPMSWVCTVPLLSTYLFRCKSLKLHCSIFSSTFSLFLCECVRVCTQAQKRRCGRQKTICRTQFSPFIVWIPGTELRPSSCLCPLSHHKSKYFLKKFQLYGAEEMLIGLREHLLLL